MKTNKEYLECLVEKEREYIEAKGIGLNIVRCYDADCPFRDECSRYRMYVGKNHKKFVEHIFSVFER